MTRLQAGSIWSNLIYNKSDEGRLTREDWMPVRKVDRTRLLCPYPDVAKYKGTGSIDEAQNFACVKP